MVMHFNMHLGSSASNSFTDVAKNSTEFAAWLWITIFLPLQNAPLSLLQHDPGRELDLLYTLPDCCQEELFVEPIVDIIRREDWKLDHWASLLRTIAQNLPLTNMSRERLIKETKDGLRNIYLLSPTAALPLPLSFVPFSF